MQTKIDHRHTYGLMIDTETANTQREENGDLDLRYVLPYDLGIAVIDTNGNVYEEHSFVISDIFVHEQDLMQSAYYANKIPLYERGLADGSRIMRNAYQVQMFLRGLCEKYNAKFIMAHNARFDYRACNNLVRWTTKSKYRYFFPKGIEFWDTMKMASDVICTMPTYIDFCEENGFVTKNGRPRKTAEVLYRFISKDVDFDEEHTGLEDVKIEVEIYKYCKRQHRKMRKRLFED